MANNSLNNDSVPLVPDFGGTGIANVGTITVGGNTEFSGAFTFVGTLTGNTAVTFPTSGTLATTSGASGIVNAGTGNQITYYATTGNAVSGLAGANGSVLVTDNTGVPSMLANPAATGRVLQSANGNIPFWSTPSYANTYAVSTLLYASSSDTVTGLATTNRASLSTNSTGVPTWLALTDGQVVVGSSAGSPAAASLTAGTGISITPGSNSITIANTGGSGTVNNGTANQIGYYATTGTAISGLTGSNGSVLVTNNTGVPSMLANPTADGRHLTSANAAIPLWSTSSYADTFGVSTILYASSANTVTGLATTNRASLSTNSTGVPTWLALTDGQIVVGSSAGSPAAASLSAGTGISITPGSNSISIAATGVSGITWANISGTTQTAAVNTGYVVGNASQTTITLPTTAALGSVVIVQGKGAGGFILAAGAGQTIQVGQSATSTAGSVTSAANYDAIQVVCITANTTWATSYVLSSGVTVA
jgi:hypothetical protein